MVCLTLSLGLHTGCTESPGPSDGLAPGGLGALQLSVEGLPSANEPAAIVLSGPEGYQRELSGSQTLTGLPTGNYSVTAVEVIIGGDRYVPAAASQSASIVPGSTASVRVVYALATARLQVDLAGVPAGSAAAVLVTGPYGFNRTLDSAAVLSGLAPGIYNVHAPGFISGGEEYKALPETREVVLAQPDTVPVVVSVVYGLVTGRLVVEVTGIPSGTPALVRITGPALDELVTQTDTLVGLFPGVYALSAESALSGAGHVYLATPGQQSMAVVAGATPTIASVSYSLAPATLTVVVTGLPAGVTAKVGVTGPNGYSAALTATQTLTGLAAGVYQIAAGTVNSGGVAYTPLPAEQSVSLNGGGSVVVTVAYPPPSGSLSVAVSGLPAGTAAVVVVSGPSGFAQSLSGSETLSGLAPGGYTISASNVTSGGTSYAPVPTGQNVTVSAGGTASVVVSYAPSGVGGADLRIDGAYLTQATQRFDGSVPLVAGRDAFLRVFALANQTNSLQPSVRVRLYHGSLLVKTYTLPGAPAGGVPITVNESSLGSSWNALVPAALVQPGLKLLADVDPSNAIVEPSESNNQFPSSGSAADVEVRALPTFAVRFVPVVQHVNGLSGSVTAATQESFLANLKKQLPVGAYSADIRAPYTTSAPVLQSSNANNAWSTVLSELLALRSADASSRYYYGVVKVSYGSGVAGMAYVGGSARTAIGWDYLPSGAHVMAHEVGHNMGRSHAPCGGASGTDPAFPYPGGQIGTWGLDVSALTLKAPTLTDVMSYCGPNWISDYNWTAMISYRQSGPNNAPAPSSSDGGLLIWGRISAGELVLEPAFRVPTGSELGPRPGGHRLELIGADGSVLRSVAFAADEVADPSGGSEQHFSFVLPMDAALEAGLAGLRVVTSQGMRSAARVALAAPDADPVPLLTRPAPGQVELRWDATKFPMALIRDARTGQVLSFARGGVTRLQSNSQSFELAFSDGLRSRSRVLR